MGEDITDDCTLNCAQFGSVFLHFRNDRLQKTENIALTMDRSSIQICLTILIINVEGYVILKLSYSRSGREYSTFIVPYHRGVDLLSLPSSPFIPLTWLPSGGCSWYLGGSKVHRALRASSYGGGGSRILPCKRRHYYFVAPEEPEKDVFFLTYVQIQSELKTK